MLFVGISRLSPQALLRREAHIFYFADEMTLFAITRREMARLPLTNGQALGLLALNILDDKDSTLNKVKKG